MSVAAIRQDATSQCSTSLLRLYRQKMWWRCSSAACGLFRQDVRKGEKSIDFLFVLLPAVFQRRANLWWWCTARLSLWPQRWSTMSPWAWRRTCGASESSATSCESIFRQQWFLKWSCTNALKKTGLTVFGFFFLSVSFYFSPIYFKHAFMLLICGGCYIKKKTPHRLI